jgi:phage/plasmid-like protein (TIGR03299 family)
MAHMIESIAYSGETPWHGLGKAVPADLSPAQMLEAADLDWTVEKIPTFAKIDGKQIYTGKDALVRSSDNSILDVVSKDWNPLQNHDAFEFFNDFVVSGDMAMHTAGSLRDGQIVWALAKVKESFELFGGDTVDSYLLFTLPHKFGQSIDVRFTPIRVVCNNTLTLSLSVKANNGVKVSHRTTFNGDSVKETLGIASDKLAKYKEMAKFLGSKKFKEESVKDYFNRIFPVNAYGRSKNEDTKAKKEMSQSATLAMMALETQPGARYAEGTWWSAFNAVTYLTDHHLGRTQEGRLASAWYGPNKALKVKALETAVEMAEVA